MVEGAKGTERRRFVVCRCGKGDSAWVAIGWSVVPHPVDGMGSCGRIRHSGSGAVEVVGVGAGQTEVLGKVAWSERCCLRQAGLSWAPGQDLNQEQAWVVSPGCRWEHGLPSLFLRSPLPSFTCARTVSGGDARLHCGCGLPCRPLAHSCVPLLSSQHWREERGGCLGSCLCRLGAAAPSGSALGRGCVEWPRPLHVCGVVPKRQTTLSGGSVGSGIDEEPSYLQELI